MAIRLASESKPTLTMPRKRLPLASPTSIGRVSPAARTSTAASGSVGDAEHAGEVVAATAGDDPERRLGAGHRAADGADQAVAAHHDRQLARLDRSQRLRRLRARGSFVRCDAEVDAPRVERLLDPRQELQRPAAGRGGVDEQRQRHSRRCPSTAWQPIGTRHGGAGRPRSCRARRAGLDRLEPAARERSRSRCGSSPRGRRGPAADGDDQVRRAAARGRSRPGTAACRPGRRGRSSRRGRAACAGVPTLKATRPSGSRPTLAVGPRIDLLGDVDAAHARRGNSRARNSAASPPAAADLEHPLGRARRAGPRRRGRQRRRGHPSMIAATPHDDDLGFSRRWRRRRIAGWIVLAVFALIAVGVVAAILIGRSGGGEGLRPRRQRHGLQAGRSAEAEARQPAGAEADG